MKKKLSKKGGKPQGKIDKAARTRQEAQVEDDQQHDDDISEECALIRAEVGSSCRIPRGVNPVSRYEWKIDRKSFEGPKMLVDSVFIANPALACKVFKEMGTHHDGFHPPLKQLANVACLPGIVEPCLGMPDLHSGYGFPIGCVAAFDVSSDNAVVSPGGVGFDINCGVRLLRTNIKASDAFKRSRVLTKLATKLFERVPCGMGAEGAHLPSEVEFKAACQGGMNWCLERGYCWPEDIEVTEERGRFELCDISLVSKRAIKRGICQLGSLGSGNHYVEVQVVDEVFDSIAAECMGLVLGNVCVMIHSGSRGFGHQVCTDALQVVYSVGKDHLDGIQLPDKQLGSLKISSDEGQQYLKAMGAAANFAFVNRTLLMKNVRDVFEEVFKNKAEELDMNMVYDVAHNIAKFEEHLTDKPIKVLVHRKGATRSFGPGSPEIPEKYRAIGQPVLIGGSMGTSSYVLLGTTRAMRETFGSTCHGAGREQSRSEAKRELKSSDVLKDLENRGIEVRIANKGAAAEEADSAYKNVDEVVETCHLSGISTKVVKLKPLAVIKG